MKKLTLTFLICLFTVLLSAPSYAEWTKVSESVDGDTYYVDFERIRKHDGYVYFWRLGDLRKPDKDGDLAYKSYIQGDCKLFRYKTLVTSYHKEPMGGGTGEVDSNPDKEWKYPPPNSVIEIILKSVCSR
jgi:hypothetical protein